ncbi:UV DNA damage repair endonuclease UvsE [Verrucomicrobiota bacterium sgz303538]
MSTTGPSVRKGKGSRSAQRSTPAAQIKPASGGVTVQNSENPLRLGFAVKVLGNPDIKSNDTRRWQKEPHLRQSLAYIRELFGYLEKHRIHMYRFSSDLAPYVTHPDMPRFHGQIRECASELRDIGQQANALGIRLSFHPSQFVVMNSPNPELVKKSLWDLSAQAEMLDLMEQGPEAVMVIHVGGLYGERDAGCRRWVETYLSAPEPVRRRLVLEHDDVSFSAADVLRIHDACGVRLIFDYQHFWCLNPEGLEIRSTLERILRSWPAGVRPKIHFSTPRTELKEVKRRDRKTGKLKQVLERATWTSHADYVNPFEFVNFMRLAQGLDFDVMLEVKRKDQALIRLRNDLARYASDVAARFGCAALSPGEIEPDTVLEDETAEISEEDVNTEA